MKEDRIITIVLRVKDAEAAKAIWEAHMNMTPVHGCLVEGIGEGDYCDKYDSALEELGELSEHYREHTGDEWEAKNL